MNKNVTPRRRANLIKLADYLESLPRDYKHFDMGNYAEHHGDHEFDAGSFEQAFYADPAETINDCGTVACAVGHGPAAGIPFAKKHLTREKSAWSNDYYYDIDWDAYASNFVDERSAAWTWMFDGFWDVVDNHHYGAAARIRYYLEHGTPDGLERWGSPQREHVELYKPYHIDNRQPATA